MLLSHHSLFSLFAFVASLTLSPSVSSSPPPSSLTTPFLGQWQVPLNSCIPSVSCCCPVSAVTISTSEVSPTDITLSGTSDGGDGCYNMKEMQGDFDVKNDHLAIFSIEDAGIQLNLTKVAEGTITLTSSKTTCVVTLKKTGNGTLAGGGKSDINGEDSDDNTDNVESAPDNGNGESGQQEGLSIGSGSGEDSLNGNDNNDNTQSQSQSQMDTEDFDNAEGAMEGPVDIHQNDNVFSIHSPDQGRREGGRGRNNNMDNNNANQFQRRGSRDMNRENGRNRRWEGQDNNEWQRRNGNGNMGQWENRNQMPRWENPYQY